MTGRLALLLLVLAPGVARAQVDAFSAVRPHPMMPERWAPSTGDDCYSRGRGRDGVIAQARICDGPRRVPVPEGEAAERAERLGLGRRPAADRMRIGRPPREWLAEIDTPPREDLLWPVARGLFSRGFGRVRRAEIRHRPHNGVDIVAEEGAHIRAVNDALVIYADNHVRGYGNLLVLLHADGTATLYGHCRAIYVAPGQRVVRGQVVGEVGNTGRPVIPHLHFEWRRDGVPMDPMGAFVERPAARSIRPDGTPESTLPPPPNSRSAPDGVGSAGGSEEEARQARGAGGSVHRDVAEGAPAGREPRAREEGRGAADAPPEARGEEEEGSAEGGPGGG